MSALAVGTTLGESVLPAIIGYLIKFFGPAALLYSVLISMIILIGIYFGMHVMNKDNSPCNNSISTDGGSDTKGMELPNLGKEINYKKLPSEEFDEVRL